MLVAVLAAAAAAGVAFPLFRSRSRQPEQQQEGEGPPGRANRKAAVVALVAGACSAAVAVLFSNHRHAKKNGSKPRTLREGRIPLKDLVRFKERQWFLEEVENSRDGDANSMLRLSKMYLHGQGCQRNIAVAQQWLGRAKYHGVGGTLDELYATDDPQPRLKLRRLAAAEEQRREALRRSSVQNART